MARGKVWKLEGGTTLNLFAEPHVTVAHDGVAPKLGAAVFFLLTALLFIFGQDTASVAQTAKFLLRDLGFSAGCGLLASFIPLGTPRTSFIYGLTMPFALAPVSLDCGPLDRTFEGGFRNA